MIVMRGDGKKVEDVTICAVLRSVTPSRVGLTPSQVWHPPKWDTPPKCGQQTPKLGNKIHAGVFINIITDVTIDFNISSWSYLAKHHQGRWGVWHIWVSSSTRTLTLLRFVLMPALCSTGALCVGHMIKTPQNYERWVPAKYCRFRNRTKILQVLQVLTAFIIKGIEKRSCHMKVINAMRVELLCATQTF